MRLLLIAMSCLIIIGCDSDSKTDAQREAFRQELIDKALNDDTRKVGEAFLAANAAVEGVVTRPSGLQYKIITDSQGASPRINQFVVVNYEGRRVDGVVFDQSAEGRPTTFPLKQVIKGWREGLSLMPLGSLWEFYVPAELAYGATSPSEQIPANSTLIFTVELVDILDSAEKEAK